MCDLGEPIKTTNARTVRGFRTWIASVSLDNLPSLVSPVFTQYQWNKTELTTDKPTADNRDGFYAFRTDYVARNYDLAGSVWGEVELSGIIVEHEYGYRAEKIKIISLSKPYLAKHFKVNICRAKRKKG